MTLPVWPTGVPSTATTDFQIAQMYNLPVSSQMNAGNIRVRQTPGSNVTLVDYPLEPLTDAEWALLETFIRTTLNNGASRFTMDVTTGGGTYATKTCLLDPTKTPQVKNQNGYVYVVLPMYIWI